MNNLLEQAQERILEMNRLMSGIEEIDRRMAGIGTENTEIAFYIPGTGTTKIADLITTEQMECIIKRVNEEIDAAKFEYTEKLTKLMGLDYDKAVPTPVTVPDVIKSRKVNLDYDTVREMYEDKNMDMKDIAAHYECAISVISKFMSANGIKARPRGGDKRKNITESFVEQKDYPNLTVEAVRKIYTDGTMSLAEAAKSFNVSSSDLHSFIEKHGLKKVPKKDKVFRDIGKSKP